MVINMDESRLRTIEQIEQFLAASAEVTFTAHGCDVERYAHISRVLKRFDYPRRSKHDRGVLLTDRPLNRLSRSITPRNRFEPRANPGFPARVAGSL